MFPFFSTAPALYGASLLVCALLGITLLAIDRANSLPRQVVGDLTVDEWALQTR